MKVRDLFAALQREPAYWGRDIVFEVILPDGEVKAGEFAQCETTIEEPKAFVLRVKVGS